LEANYSWDCAGCECPGDGDAVCGDGYCTGDETYDNCPEDCNEPGTCDEGYVIDCVDDDCCLESWIGDGWGDCEDQAYGCDLTCYDNDGGDCDGDPGHGNQGTKSTGILPFTGLTHEQIAAIKQQTAENRRSVFNMINPPTIYSVEGDLILQGTSEDRSISFDVHTFCDACIEGGPWDAMWTSIASEILIYNFEEGAEVCAEVRAVSGNTGGVSDWTDAACANAGEPTCVTGDANNDTHVNVSDIVNIVNLILSGGTSVDDAIAAGLTACSDYNGDGNVNVSDIVNIVNLILSGEAPLSSPASSSTLINKDGNVSLTANGTVDAVQMTLNHGEDFAIELTENAMVAEYKNHGEKTILVIVVPEGEHLFTAEGDFTISEVIVANMNGNIEVAMDIPTEFSVSDAYPNPFNPVTNLNLTLPSEVMVDVRVYSVTGQVVDVITSRTMAAGYHTLAWNAADLSSGMYFIRTEAGENVSTQKVMLLK